jgi:hypothetical protein
MTHPLPELYARWTRELLGADPPGEPKATCDDCAMCVKDSGTLPTSVYFFRPELKCCVYMPRLPNFVVGKALADDGPGTPSVEERLAGAAASPLGLGRDPSYELLLRNSVNAIGRAEALRCPHFVPEADGKPGSGGCGIYGNRDATCSTWFCRHERGAVGGAFWRALRQLLSTVERELALWSAVELGLAPEQLENALPNSPDEEHLPRPKPDAASFDGPLPGSRRKALWGRWVGHESDFFKACAARVSALSWEDVIVICGPDVRVRAEVVRARHKATLSFTLPKRLVVGSFEVVGSREGGVRAVTYSSLDAIDLPSALFGLLPLFDGRPTDDVLAQLKDTYGVEVEPAFLQQLVDWGVLAAAPAASETER